MLSVLRRSEGLARQDDSGRLGDPSLPEDFEGEAGGEPEPVREGEDSVTSAL